MFPHIRIAVLTAALGSPAAALRGEPATTALDTVLSHWRGWTLARQFTLCASLVLLPVMALTGRWVTSLVEDQVTRNSATAAALYVESVIDPLIQELGTGEQISAANKVRLERLLDETSLGQQVYSFIIWRGDGRVVFSSSRELIGKTFAVSARQRAAWQGTVSAEYSRNATAQTAGIPLTEVYVPVRERGSSRVIAVAEFYQKSGTLERELAVARRQAWLRIGGISFAMLAALFLIVRRGSRTIETQREALETRIDDLERLVRENAELRKRIEQASARASESNELFLKRLGADLHDGPAQLLSLALLALDDRDVTPATPVERQSAPTRRPTTREIVDQALRELRQLAAGLALPEIATMTVAGTIRAAVQRHAELTGTHVTVDVPNIPCIATPALKTCIYRVVQEGLTNALKHAGGAGQSVSARGEVGIIQVVVADSGAGYMPGLDDRPSFGVSAMRDRVESLGGEFKLTSRRGVGTRIRVRLPLMQGT